MQDTPLPAVVIEPIGAHRATIIWLHGLGADGHDFEPIAGELQLPEALGVRFILPHAPHRPVTLNGGYVMRAWYDIASADINRTPDENGIQASRQAVEQFIDSEIAQGIKPERVILAGFSQGGVIALETATHQQSKVGGVIALSCYTAFPQRIPPARRPLPIFMGHGAQDAIVPLALGLAARNGLESRGYTVEWRDYPMPHSVCWEEIADIRRWLLERLQDRP
jgi:phospholipase/carboxylesterase